MDDFCFYFRHVQCSQISGLNSLSQLGLELLTWAELSV